MGKYRVWIKFKGSDEMHLDSDWCSQEELMSSLQRLHHGPAALMGIISEIKVVDKMDCIVYLVQNGKQIWPKAA